MAVTSDQIQALYVAYFNRPADYLGLTFQLNVANQAGLQLVADQFSKSPEYTATYAGKTTAEIVDTIYMNLFGRHAEPAGLKFWGDLLNNPASGITVGNAALTIFNGAINGDRTSVDNKLKAANFFYNSLDTSFEVISYTGANANAVLKSWMSGITTDASYAASTSAKAMQDLADAYIAAYGAAENPGASGLVISVDATTTAFSGGSGNDIVTLVNTGTAKPVALNDGNDNLKLAVGTTALASFMSGGNGIDTLTMAAADAATVSVSDAFALKFDGFEKLSLAAVAAAGTATIDLANMDNINYVVTAGIGAGGALSLVKLAANSTIELTGAAAGQVTTAVLADATGTADVLKIATRVNSAGIDFGTVKADGVETVKLTLIDSDIKVGTDTATLNLVGDMLKSLEVTGNANLTLTGGAALKTINAAAMTGALVVASTQATSITGGTAADSLSTSADGATLNGGAGADTLTAVGSLDTLTGGADLDTFVVSKVSVGLNNYTTITDASAGDVITLNGSGAVFKSASVMLGDTAVLQDFANYAISVTDAGDVTWFQYKGNTFLVQNISNNASGFVNGTDHVVKLTGVLDLSAASYNATFDTLLIL
jgi:S-layer protein